MLTVQFTSPFLITSEMDDDVIVTLVLETAAELNSTNLNVTVDVLTTLPLRLPGIGGISMCQL